MNLTNYCNKVSDKQVEQLIGLLEEDVRNMNGDIKIYGNFEQALQNLPKETPEEYLESVKRGEEYSAYIYDGYNEIALYNFNIFTREDMCDPTNFTFFLYFQIRSMYQTTYLSKKKEQEEEKDDGEGTPYLLKWYVIDASYFASKWMIENKKEIQKILGEPYDYEIDLQRYIKNYEQLQTIQMV